MSQTVLPVDAGLHPIRVVRLPLDKLQAAVAFLHERSGGVMEMIAHFWERLAQTPPLQRGDLHMVVAGPVVNNSRNVDINISTLDCGHLTGAMLYVPKAHRADVLALDELTARAFAGYIIQKGGSPTASGSGQNAENGEGARGSLGSLDSKSFVDNDLSGFLEVDSTDKVAIDFLTGGAEGIQWMVPLLLPHVGKRAPARQLVNEVMHLPPLVQVVGEPAVRLARDPDRPTLNRWRRQYMEERGLTFDADIDAMVDAGRVFVFEHEQNVVAVAKFDLELAQIIEIGGVYTFPEFRKHGFGGRIVADLAGRIRLKGKKPVLQVDHANDVALRLYQGSGWKSQGRLARVWLTG